MRRALAVACVAIAACALPSVAAAKGVPKDFFGVVTQEELKGSDYARMAEGRVGTVRTVVYWSQIQFGPGKCQSDVQVGVCNWRVLDEVVANAAIAGTKVLPVIGGIPSFVSSKPNNPPIKNSDAKQWQAFLKAAAERYGKGGHFWQEYQGYVPKDVPITDWQIWNEPNSKAGWNGHPEPKKYAKLIKVSAKGLRKGDKKANVVLGGMFGDSKLPITDFLRQFYNVKKIEKYFDTIAVHPYAPQIGDLKRQLRQVRSAAKKGGDRGAKIHITEMGWSSANGRHPLMKGPKGQAKMLGKAFRLLKKKRKGWNLDGVNWFALQDTNNKATCSFCLDSGLIQTNGNAKPSWQEFKKFTK